MFQKLARAVRGNAVAYLALFIALSGTALAATGGLSPNSVGTTQLRNGAVTGNKVARHTLTGANIKLATLGTVPKATNATHATDATNAANAANATNATNATNAAQLGGQSPAAFQHRVTGTCASGSAISAIDQSGTPSCQTTNMTQMMGGSIGTIGLSNCTCWVAPEGLSTPSTTEAALEVGASAVQSTAANLSVSVSTAPGNGDSWLFALYVNGVQTALFCSIANSATSCSDTQHAVTVPAGARVSFVAGPGTTSPPTPAPFQDAQLLFGWTDST